MSWDQSKARKLPVGAGLLAAGGLALSACATVPSDTAPSPEEPSSVEPGETQTLSYEVPPPPPPPPPPVASEMPPPTGAARPRTGPTRGSGTTTPSMIVIRGSDDALVWYPIGRKVRVTARICLPRNSRYITFQRLDGGTVTYGGGGCNKVIEEPARDTRNSGGTGSGL